MHPDQPARFNDVMGELMLRREGDGQARVRMMPVAQHSNFSDVIHGGATLTFIDIAMFAAARILGMSGDHHAVTVDLSNQFVGAGRIGEPFDALIEMVRETRHLVFLRGMTLQGETVVSNFTGLLKKTKSVA